MSQWLIYRGALVNPTLLNAAVVSYYRKTLYAGQCSGDGNQITLHDIIIHLKTLRQNLVEGPHLTNSDDVYKLLNEFVRNINNNLTQLDFRTFFSDICELICLLTSIEFTLMMDCQIEKPVDLESRHICSRHEFLKRQTFMLARCLISGKVEVFVNSLKSVIKEACASTKLAESPYTLSFSTKANCSGSVRFVLLYMRYFASAASGKFLTPNLSVTNESADRTQAIVSTACTAWLSAVGAAVGLPASGFTMSSSVQHLCELVIDTLLPTILAFLVSFDDNRTVSNADVVLAFFDPLIDLFSGSVKIPGTQRQLLMEQVADLMVGDADALDADAVLKHIEKMALSIAGLLVLRTLCEIMCTVLQDTNLTSPDGGALNLIDYVEGIILRLTDCGKQFDSVVRQIADRITEVAINHSKFVSLSPLRPLPVHKLLDALNTGDFHVVPAVKHRSLDLHAWTTFMDKLWNTFCSTFPAGLARQMYARISSEGLLHIVQQVANVNPGNDDEHNAVKSFTWSAMKVAHRLIFRCTETEADVLGHGLLSVDLQSIHSASLMLTQCLLCFGAPTDLLSALHTRRFCAEMDDVLPSSPFELSTWLKVIDHRLFNHPSSETQQVLVMLRHFGSSPYFDPVTALTLAFTDGGELLKPILHSEWANAKQSEEEFKSIFEVYKAFFKLFATEHVANGCYSTILGPLFGRLKHLQIFDLESTESYPVWLEALIEFVEDSMQLISKKIHDLALDRVMLAEIKAGIAKADTTDAVCLSERCQEGICPPSESTDDLCGCAFSPGSSIHFVKIANEVFSLAMENLPPDLLAFFGQQDAIFRTADGTYTPCGGTTALQIILVSIKRRITSMAIDDSIEHECCKILSTIVYILNTEVKEDVISSRENFRRYLTQASDLDSAPNTHPNGFCRCPDDKKPPAERRLRITQQLRHIQSAAFGALQKVHEIMKLNVELLLTTYMRAHNIDAYDQSQMSASPKLRGDPMPFFENRCSKIEEISWDYLCQCEIGLTSATFFRLLSMRPTT
uniref:HECT domain-containing protein n=1 Tax=Mesocestoides corti TaxID=53468 RepID=A0A5K3F7C8_MESCO